MKMFGIILAVAAQSFGVLDCSDPPESTISAYRMYSLTFVNDLEVPDDGGGLDIDATCEDPDTGETGRFNGTLWKGTLYIDKPATRVGESSGTYTLYLSIEGNVTDEAGRTEPADGLQAFEDDWSRTVIDAKTYEYTFELPGRSTTTTTGTEEFSLSEFEHAGRSRLHIADWGGVNSGCNLPLMSLSFRSVESRDNYRF